MKEVGVRKNGAKPSAVVYFMSLPWPYRSLYSCARQKGRKDSDGRVQDVRLRISEFYSKIQTKYKDK